MLYPGRSFSTCTVAAKSFWTECWGNSNRGLCAATVPMNVLTIFVRKKYTCYRNVNIKTNRKHSLVSIGLHYLQCYKLYTAGQGRTDLYILDCTLYYTSPILWIKLGRTSFAYILPERNEEWKLIIRLKIQSPANKKWSAHFLYPSCLPPCLPARTDMLHDSNHPWLNLLQPFWTSTCTHALV